MRYKSMHLYTLHAVIILMKIGSTIIKIRNREIEIYARQGVNGNIFYESYSDRIKGFRVFNNYQALQKAYWSALVTIDEAHFLSLCVTSFQVADLSSKEVVAI